MSTQKSDREKAAAELQRYLSQQVDIDAPVFNAIKVTVIPQIGNDFCVCINRFDGMTWSVPVRLMVAPEAHYPWLLNCVRAVISTFPKGKL